MMFGGSRLFNNDPFFADPFMGASDPRIPRRVCHLLLQTTPLTTSSRAVSNLNIQANPPPTNIIIEEINDDDEDQTEEEEREQAYRPNQHRRSSQPIVEEAGEQGML